MLQPLRAVKVEGERRFSWFPLLKSGFYALLLALLENVLHHRQGRKCTWPACVKRDVCQHFGGLFSRQAVVHRATEVIGDLRGLPIRNQCAHGHKTAVARLKRGAEPQVAEEKVRRVLYKTGRDGPEVVSNLRRPLSLGFLVERQQLVLRWRKLIGTDTASMEDVLCHRDSRHRIGPSGVEGKVRDDLGKLRGFHAIVESKRKMIRHLDGLNTSDQRGHSDHAAITQRKLRALPQSVEKRPFGVVSQCG